MRNWEKLKVSSICTAANRALAKCGAENPNWKAGKIIRKKLFNFVFFCKFTSLKKLLASVCLSWTEVLRKPALRQCFFVVRKKTKDAASFLNAFLLLFSWKNRAEFLNLIWIIFAEFCKENSKLCTDFDRKNQFWTCWILKKN